MEIKCLIQTVDLPGTTELPLQGLIVVIGPNSSGKSQLLHDLNEAVCGRSRDLVVISGISFRQPPPFEEYFSSLVDRGTIRESGPDQFLKQSIQFGADEGGGSFRKSQIQSKHQQFVQAAENKIEKSLPGFPYLNDVESFICSALFLKNRLTLMDSCSTYDYLNQGPSRTLQSLYMNKNAKIALTDETERIFQRSVWVDNTRHTQLVLRVFDIAGLPPAEDRLEPELMENFRTIETEGDGVRSYSAICATLLLGS